jgi:hypothetical protein
MATHAWCALSRPGFHGGLVHANGGGPTFRQYVYETTTDAERKQAKNRWNAQQDKRRAARRARGSTAQKR